MAAPKVLVTGGAGFIGSHICEMLIASGYSVVAFDDLSVGRVENLSSIVGNREFKFIKGSILDAGHLADAMQGASYVLHQAAIPSIQRSMENPERTNEVNVSGTLAVLVQAHRSEISRVVIASSSSVYGDTPELPKHEDLIPHPKSVYAVSKFTCEQYAQAFNRTYGMSNACLRYFNVYGPRQDEKSQYAAAIPKFISCAKKREPLTIYGTGKQTRDFTYVDDVARANLLALKNKAEGVFNIGSGRNTSIIELANLVEELTGRKLVRHYKPARPEDVLDSLADISRAEATFGYGPMFDLRTGLRKMIASSD